MDRKINPLKARNRFKARLLFGMVLKPLRLFCQRCDKYMPSDIEWRCAHCGYHNEGTRIYSFLNKCQQCKRPPKSVMCPSCKDVNFLDKDRDGSHPAKPILILKEEARDLLRPAGPTQEQIDAEKRAKERMQKSEEHADRKTDISREIEIAELDARLAKWKTAAEANSGNAILDNLRKDGERHVLHNMGVQIVAKELAEKYKQLAPEMTEQNEATIRNWAEDQALSDKG
jgi:ribosomal protein L37E